MKFRLKAFGLHLASSVAVLTLVLGSLYLGWYSWPGWFLTDVLHVVPIMLGVDVALGPLLTLVIANPAKARRTLARDIGVIAIVQLAALAYGTTALWQGRPLYYAFSVNQLQVVQASDLSAAEIDLARKARSAFVPHWYSLPRWIWAPLPQDTESSDKIVASAVAGGDDVIDMPRYFRPWEQGTAELRGQLKRVDASPMFIPAERKVLKEKMTRLGFAPDQPNTLAVTGRGKPLLAVFDTNTLRIKAILASGPYRAHPFN